MATINVQIDNKNEFGYDSSILSDEPVYENDELNEEFIGDLFNYVSNQLKLDKSHTIKDNAIDNKVVKRIPKFTNDNPKFDKLDLRYNTSPTIKKITDDYKFNTLPSFKNMKPINIDDMKKILILNPANERINYTKEDDNIYYAEALYFIVRVWDNDNFGAVLSGTRDDGSEEQVFFFVTPDKKLMFVDPVNDKIYEPTPVLTPRYWNYREPFDFKGGFYPFEEKYI